MPSKAAATRAAATTVMEAGFAFMRHVRDQARAAAQDGSADLSFPELRFLGILAKEPERTLRDVAADLCVTPAAITKLADGLEARGLLTRSAAASDRRRVHVAPTRRGHDALAKAKARFLDGLVARLEGLPQEDLAALAASMPIVSRRLAPLPASARAPGLMGVAA